VLGCFNESSLSCFQYQCEQVHWLFNLSDCCSDPTPFHCDESATASQQKRVLDHWGFDSVLITSSLSWDDLKKEIKAGRPINIGWQWCTIGGHSLNIYGFKQVKNSSIEQNVMYMDPAKGQGYNVADYDWLIGQCPGLHTWYRTLYNIRKR